MEIYKEFNFDFNKNSTIKLDAIPLVQKNQKRRNVSSKNSSWAIIKNCLCC